MIVNRIYGGEFVSAVVDGCSHWFNRVVLCGRKVDVDLTGDQFGRHPVQVCLLEPDDSISLYEGERVRDPSELTESTVARAMILAERAGLTESMGQHG